ncbi:MAG: 4-hydroxy-tetrahydrodipicolinate synthase [Clostridiales bacterium]|nr:4-hydroxy-tetrahydrodipicolinate synthase [Clostridiales bacterium]
MRKPLFTGCGTALVTPFRNGEVDYDALDRLVEDQLANGVTALIAVGTTGEPSTMSWDEHLAVIRRVVEKVDHRVPVIAGTGSNATSEAVYAAKHAADFGADAQLVVTPYYNKTSQAGLVAHFNAIADAATLPVIVYNVPSRTGLNIGPEALAKICEHENVIAVKEASPDVAQAMEKMRLCGDKVDFYCGNDDLIVPTISIGFKGVISVLSNVLPAETSRMANLALEGRCKEAAEIQLRLLPFINALFSETSPIPIKAAMAKVGMLEDELRLPLVPMTKAPRDKMYAIMRDLGMI